MNGSNKFSSLILLKRGVSLSLLDKLALSNSFMIPKLIKITVFIVLKSLDNFDSSRLVASTFLLRVLSKQRPYVVRFGLFQSFKERECDMLVQVSLCRLKMYEFLSFLVYEVIPFLPKSDFVISYSSCKSSVVAFFTISNLSFIRFIEMHSAFFR